MAFYLDRLVLPRGLSKVGMSHHPLSEGNSNQTANHISGSQILVNRSTPLTAPRYLGYFAT
jgi:hypothetical protein